MTVYIIAEHHLIGEAFFKELFCIFFSLSQPLHFVGPVNCFLLKRVEFWLLLAKHRS